MARGTPLKNRRVVDLAGGKALGKALVAGELTDAEIRTLPAQSLYIAMQTVGPEACTSMLEAVTAEQYRLLLDFDFWHKDNFQQERFFDWLTLVDAEDSLEGLEKLYRSIDREVLGLMISRFVESVVFEEQTDLPPGPDFYTPDKGSTWVRIAVEDPEQHRVFSKFLAYIFQRDAQIFYQLLNSDAMGTSIEVEEHCFRVKESRLAGEGVPEHDTAWRINTPLSQQQIAEGLARESGSAQSRPAVAAREAGLQPLTAFLQELAAALSEDERDQLEAELARIVNAGIVFYGISFQELDELGELSAKVKGAVNIGIERLISAGSKGYLAMYRAFSLQGLYQAGLSVLGPLRRAASRVPHDLIDPTSPLSAVIASAAELFPVRPAELNLESLEWQTLDRSASKRHEPFEHAADVETVQRLVESVRR